MAQRYVASEPPVVEGEDARKLAEWLGRELRAIETFLNNTVNVEWITEEPDVIEDGDAVYIPVVDAAFTGSPGFFGRVSGAWTKW